MTSRYPAIAPDILALFAARGAATGRRAGHPAGRPVPRHGRRGSAPPHLPHRERDRRHALPAPRIHHPRLPRPHRQPGRHAAPLFLSRRGVPPAPRGRQRVLPGRHRGPRRQGYRPRRRPLAGRRPCAADAHAARPAIDRHARRPVDLRGGAGRARPAARLAHAARPRLRLGRAACGRARRPRQSARRTARCRSRSRRSSPTATSTALAEHIAADMAEAGLSPTSGRTPQEIAGAWSRRPNCAACASRPRPLPRSKPSLPSRCRSTRAAAALEAFAKSAGLSLGAALANFSARVEAVAAQGPAARQPSATTPPSAARSTIIPASSSRFPPATVLLKHSAPACRRRPLRPAAHPARRENANPRRRLLRLARPHRGAQGRGRMTITLAIPSKGRLKDQSLEMLAKAGLAVSLPGDDRKYRARIEGRDDIEIAFLSASEISGEIGQGSVDLGITGEDLLRENVADWEQQGRDRGPPWLRSRRCGGRRAGILARRRHHGRPRRRRRRVPPAPRPAAAHRHQILAADPAVLLAASTASRSTASSKASAPPKARRPPARPTSSSTSPRPARRCAPTT